MNIALYDADFERYGISRPYSYNLMKLSAYHKKKRDVVRRITDLSKADLYSKVYYNQDYDSTFDPNIVKYDNIEIIGYKMSGGKLYNFPPDAKSCLCDTSIYPGRETYKKEIDQKYANYLSRTANIVLETDKKPILRFNQPVILHDFDFCGLPDWQEKLTDYIKDTEGRTTSIATRMPQYPRSLEDIKFLTKIPCNNHYTCFHTDFKLNDDGFEEYIRESKSTFASLNYFAINDKLAYSKSELVQLEIEILRRNFFSRQNGRDFLLYNKGICENPNLDSFFDLLIMWNNNIFRWPKNRRKSFADYVGTVHEYSDNKNKYITRELFNQVVDLKTYAKIDIAKIIAEGGEWPL